MPSGRGHGIRIAAAVALAVLGFAASFGLGRVTREGESGPDDAGGLTEARAASVAALPVEAARIARLKAASAVPALRPAPTTAPAVQPTPVQTPRARATPTRTAAPAPKTTAPAPAKTTTPSITTYIVP